MKKIYFKSICISFIMLIFIFFTENAEAQNRFLVKNLMQKYQEAIYAYQQGLYYNAIETFKIVTEQLEDEEITDRCTYYIAESYRKMYNYKEAAEWYKKCMKIKLDNKWLNYKYAQMLRSQGLYEEAIKEFVNIQTSNDDTVLTNRAKKAAAACNMATDWKFVPTRHIVKNLSPLNSKYDDYRPFYADKRGKTVLFTSNREGTLGKGNDPVTGFYKPDIFYTKINTRSNTIDDPLPYEEYPNTENPEMDASCDVKGSVIYFSRYTEEKGFSLYFAKRKGLSWDWPDELPIPGINDTIIVGQPVESPDALRLYFSANFEGGYGGTDLYYVERRRKRDQWIAKPVNLGPHINTPGNEKYPFIDRQGNLYFSSDGHPGMGGLDVFFAKVDTTNKFLKPENMKYPVNSASEDFGYIIDEYNKTGYFSSNRDGGKGGFDIYAFEIPELEITLEVTVVDNKTRVPIPNVALNVLYPDSVTQKNYTSNDNGWIKIPNLKENSIYTLNLKVVDEKGNVLYEELSTTVNTTDYPDEEEIKINIELEPIPQPDLLEEDDDEDENLDEE